MAVPAAADTVKQCVQVFLRIRPPLEGESSPKTIRVESSESISVRVAQTGEKKYHYDGILAQNYSQTDVYKILLEPQLPRLLKGHNCTLLAFGPALSGKSYTMIGDDKFLESNQGLVLRVPVDLFRVLDDKMKKTRTSDYTVFLSAVEIQNETIRDLTHKDGKLLQLYNDSHSKNTVCLKDVTENYFASAAEAVEYIKRCLSHCAPNSHRLFTVTIKFREINVKGEEIVTTSKLSLFDLSSVDGKSKSITNLINVVRAIAGRQSHIPYRDSKLTRVLQDSIGGESFTTLIATIAHTSPKESLMTTLDFAQSAKSIENTPKVNVCVSQDAAISRLMEQGAKLKRDLDAARRGEGFYITKASYDELEYENNQKSTKLKEQRTKCEQLRETMLDHVQKLNTRKAHLQEESLKMEARRAQLAMQEDKVRRLNRTKEELAELYKLSSEREEIFYGKYVKQTIGTGQNAEVAHEIARKHSESIKQLDIVTKQFQERNCQNLETVESIVDDMEQKRNTNRKSLESLLETYRQFATVDFSSERIETVLSAMQKLLVNHYRTPIQCLREKVNTCDNWTSEQTNATNAIAERLFQKIVTIGDTVATLKNNNKTCLGQIVECQSKQEKIFALLKQCLESNNDIPPSDDLIRDDGTNPETILCNSVKQLATDQSDNGENVSKNLNALKTQLENADVDLDAKHVDEINHLGTYVHYHMNQVGLSIDEHVTFLVDELDHDSELATKDHRQMKSALDMMKVETKNYVSDFDLFSVNCRQKMDNLGDLLARQVHDGDTPIKKVRCIPNEF